MPETPLDPVRLAQGAEALSVALSPDQASALAGFGELLLRWNRAFNLISRRDVDRLVPRHLLDSLSVAPLLDGRDVMDLGTGAGLPGVPLAIAREDLRFTLVDRNERKIRFIERAVRSLNLSNVSAWCGDVNDMPAQAGFDCVVCRAVADPQSCWQLVAGRLRPGGRLLVMHRGQGADDADSDAPSTAAVDRRSVRIPGLERAHEIIVLRRDDKMRSAP